MHRAYPRRAWLRQRDALDGSQDLADGSSVFRAPLGMGEHDGSLSVEDEIASELTSVLAEVTSGDPPPQQRPAVEGDDFGMRGSSQERRPPSSKVRYAVPCGSRATRNGSCSRS